MNQNSRVWQLGVLAVFPLVSACSWDFTKLPPAKFRKTLCDAVDAFQKNAQANAAAIQDPARRDQAYAQINTQLQQLTTEKLRAINAYTNCNEAQLEAAQAAVKNVIDAISRVVGANMKNPIDQISFAVRGNKPPGSGTLQLNIQTGNTVLVAGPTPTDPLELRGFMVCNFRSTPQGYTGEVEDLEWEVFFPPGVSYWNICIEPAPSNTFWITRHLNGYTGAIHLNLVVDGRGISWPIIVDLPLTMDLSQTQWGISSNGMRPAIDFFPEAPQANIRHGHGCAGGLVAEPELNPFSVSRVGDPLVLRVDAAPATGFSTLILGLAPTRFDLSPFFGRGCELFTSPDLMLMAPLDPIGTALHTLPVPPDPTLAGLTLHMQALVLAPSGTGLAGGLSMPVKQTLDAR